MLKILLIRHGDIGKSGLYIGSTDIELSQHGRNQIKGLSLLLQKNKISKIYCSPLKRCVQSVELLNLPVSPVIVEDIREIDFGEWEEKTFQQIQAQYKDEVKDWAEAEDNFRFPEGELMNDFHHRIQKFAKKISSGEGKEIAIITHGGVIRHLICFFLGLSYKNYLLFNVDYGSITEIHLFKEGGILAALNIRNYYG